MKKLVILFWILVILFIAGCNTEREERLNYTAIPYEQIPYQYEDGTFSIKGFLAVKDKYENQSVNIRGIINYIYECPPCPKGMLCKGCSNNYIQLADPVKNITVENKIPLNFFKDSEIYQSLKLGEEIKINMKYNLVGEGGVVGKNGYFVYNSLTKI